MTNFEIIKTLYQLGIAKDEIFDYVKNGKLTPDEYKSIAGEDCPEIPLDNLKANKIKELENKADSIIAGGFDSNCLGTTKHFDTDGNNIGYIQGLANKAALIKSGADLPDKNLDWKTSDDAVCYPWTPDQVIILGVDLSTFMTSNIKKKETLQSYVRSLTNATDINSVTWDTVIPDTTSTSTPDTTSTPDATTTTTNN